MTTHRISWRGTVGCWYYIEHRNNPYKVLYADGFGCLYYGERDLPRVVPVIYNNRPEAARVARYHKGRVRNYPYRLTEVEK